MRREAAAAAVAALALAAVAAWGAQPAVADELAAPPPPAPHTDHLIRLDMPGRLLHYGVDPASIVIAPDGVVFYVVVAASDSGAVNAVYEGIRCAAGVYRVYARHDPQRGWVPASGEWQSLNDPWMRTSHTLLIARTGACMGDAPNTSAGQVARDLAGSGNSRFRGEYR
jgi:hypothetical protein